MNALTNLLVSKITPDSHQQARSFSAHGTRTTKEIKMKKKWNLAAVAALALAVAMGSNLPRAYAAAAGVAVASFFSGIGLPDASFFEVFSVNGFTTRSSSPISGARR